MRLSTVHAICMFTSFGVMLPIGAFLAFTGFHKYHVYMQCTAVIIAVVGAGVAINMVEGWGVPHFQGAHGKLGLLILLNTLALQPYAIWRKWIKIHHRNGSLLIVGGFTNIFLGMTAISLDSGYLVMYIFWLSLLLIGFIFDPMQMRSRRMIQMAQMKQRGENIVVSIAQLFRARDGTRDDNSASRSRTAQSIKLLRRAFTKQPTSRSRTTPALPKLSEDGADDSDGSAADPAQEEAPAAAFNSGDTWSDSLHKRWSCDVTKVGCHVQLRMPNDNITFT